MTEVIVLPETQKELEAVFIDGKDIDPVLAVIREQIKDLPVDMTVRKNREARAAFAYKIARSKVAVDKAGATISAKYKEIPKKIDANRRAYREMFEAEQANARAPLDEWERNEKARQERHQARIDNLISNTAFYAETCAATLEAALEMLEELVVDESWEEFEDEAQRIKQKATEEISAQLERRKVYEAEQAELAQLRAEAEERAKADREAQAAAEAAEAARVAAEKIAADKIKEAKRHAEKLAKEAADKAAREADIEHKAAVNRAALAALVDNCELSEAQARAVVTAIAKGLIPNIKINY